MDTYETYDYDDSNNEDYLDCEEECEQLNNRTFLYRRQTQKQKDFKRRKIINYGGYAPHVGYINWDWVDGKLIQTGNYIKYPRASNCQRWMKKLTSKRARKADVPNGNGYRKVFDYWNTLY